MTESTPPLGVLSDEFDRVLKHIDHRIEGVGHHIDQRLREEREHSDRRIDETKTELVKQTAVNAAAVSQVNASITAMNATLAGHNGRLTKVEKFLEYMRGMKDGAGGSGRLMLTIYGAIATAVAIAGGVAALLRLG
jgi:methyl-accepting chemotaxis protein